jgi:hypothetical protein
VSVVRLQIRFPFFSFLLLLLLLLLPPYGLNILQTLIKPSPVTNVTVIVLKFHEQSSIRVKTVLFISE